MIRAGSLRHVVVIQAPVETKNEYGELETTGWADFAMRRAAVEPISGREYFAARQVQSDVTTRFRLRWLDGVTTGMRLVHKGRCFDIQAVINSFEESREMVLMAVERPE